MTALKINPNAPYIREIIDRSANVGGQRIEGDTREEMRASLNSILDKQFIRAKKTNVRTKAY